MQPLASTDTEPAVKDTAHNAATINLRIGFLSPVRCGSTGTGTPAPRAFGPIPVLTPAQILRVGSVFGGIVPAFLVGCKAWPLRSSSISTSVRRTLSVMVSVRS